MILELDNKYIKLNYSLQFSIGILGFFIYLILGNRYELVELADFFKVVAYISIIQIITDYGFDYGNLRNINISKIKKTNLLISTSSVKIVFGIASFILSFILSCFTDLTFEPTLIFLGAILSILNLSWFFYLTKNSFVYGLFSLSFRIVALFYLFFFVGSAFNLNIILAVLYIPIILPTIIFIIYYYYYYYYYDKEEFSQSQLEINFLKSIKDNFTIFFNNVLVSIITTSWPLTLSVFVAPEMVSVYGFIEKVNKGLLLAFRPLPFFLLTGSVKIKNLIFSYKNFLILILLFIVVLIFIFNLDLILNLFFSNKFIDYMSYFQFYLIQIPITLSLMIIYTYLIQANSEGLYSISNLIGLIFVLILSSFIKVNIFFPLIFEIAVLISIPVALFIRASFKKFQKY